MSSQQQPASADAPLAHAIAHDGWGELVLARPARKNAIIGPMVGEMRAALAKLLQGGARVIVLRGEGGAFCSGLDIDAFAQTPPPAWRQTFAADWAAWHLDLYRCPAVIICALERFAINGGSSMVFAGDLVIAGEEAFVLVGEAIQGMAAPMNVAWLRIRTTEAIAAQLTLAPRRMKGAELSRLGLAYEVVADDQVAARACELAATLAGYPGSGLANIKAGLRKYGAAGDGEDWFRPVQVTGGGAGSSPRRI
jgi:enoyl-CoA hydratase/carnithine racemase